MVWLVSNEHRQIEIQYSQNPWVVRKILARTYRLKRHNEENNTNIFVNRSLSKEEQQKKKDCLTKRWKLISEENYDKTKFRIINLKFNGNEISTKNDSHGYD